MKLIKTLSKYSTLRQSCQVSVSQCRFFSMVNQSQNFTATVHQTRDLSKILSETADNGCFAEEQEDLSKESGDLDLDVEEERVERSIGARRKSASKIVPRTFFKTRNFYYFNAYCLAKNLSNRSQAEFLYPILKNGQNGCYRSFKEKLLLCNLPSGCYNFHPKHCFPDDDCLDNYVSIVDLSVDNNCIERDGLSKALIGLAKISSVDDDLIEKIGGFKRLTKWFAFACGENQKTLDASTEALVISTCLRAAHIFMRQTGKKSPDFEIFAGFVSSKLEEFVGIKLSEYRSLDENQKSGEKRDKIILEIILAITDVECGFAKYSVLNETVQSEVIDLAVTNFEDYLLPGYCLAKSMREKFVFCAAIRKLANVMQNWNAIHESFWRRFFEFCLANYGQLKKDFGLLAASQWIKIGLYFLLDVCRLENRTFSSDFDQFVLEGLRPFIMSHVNQSVVCLRRTECLVLRAKTRDCLTRNCYEILSKDDLENLFLLAEKYYK